MRLHGKTAPWAKEVGAGQRRRSYRQVVDHLGMALAVSDLVACSLSLATLPAHTLEQEQSLNEDI